MSARPSERRPLRPFLRPLLRPLMVALVCLLAAATTGCVPTSNPLARTATITVFLPDTAGLFEGNDVGILGVPVGTVTDIEPEGTQVRVTLEVEADRAIPADAGAVVVARSVATDRYVELTPVYRSGPELADGDVIPVERTRTPVDFDEVLGALETVATGISGSRQGTEAVRRLVEDGEAALRGNGRQLQETVGSLADAVEGVSGQREEISGALTALDLLVGDVADNAATTREFLDQVATASEILAAERGRFRRALVALERAVTTVSDFARTNREAVVETIGGTSRAFRTMLRKQRQLAEILEVFPLVLQNLQRAAPGDRLPTRVSPEILLPLGSELLDACEQVAAPLCELLGTDPGDRAPAGRSSSGGRR